MKKNDGLGNKPIIVIVGIIASIIGIFTFVSGKQSIKEIIATPEIDPFQETQSFKETRDSTETPIGILSTNTLVNESGSTDIPITSIPTNIEPTITPMVIEYSNPGVSITIRDLNPISSGEQGGVRVQFLSGNEPLREVGIWFHKAAQDITGKWTLIEGLNRNGYMVNGKTNENGIIEEYLDAGNYAVWNEDYSANWNQLNGTWGEKANYLDWKDPMQVIVFSVQPGKLTDIKVSLAHLEIGIVDKNENAITNRLIYLFCQSTDVAGKKIPTNCGDGENIKKTDYTGLTSFNLGAGTYMIEVVGVNYEGDYSFYDIAVQPGESRRDIFVVDK